MTNHQAILHARHDLKILLLHSPNLAVRGNEVAAECLGDGVSGLD
jgi:hypothetical protein